MPEAPSLIVVRLRQVCCQTEIKSSCMSSAPSPPSAAAAASASWRLWRLFTQQLFLNFAARSHLLVLPTPMSIEEAHEGDLHRHSKARRKTHHTVHVRHGHNHHENKDKSGAELDVHDAKRTRSPWAPSLRSMWTWPLLNRHAGNRQT